ncbi:MAG: hypothetical protein QOJ08_80 [Ilumatobacteraceae bacterium]|jgi:hypothetical protein
MKRFAADHNRLRIGMAIYVLAAISLVLAIVTAMWPTWLEDTLGVSPDRGSGETESGIVLAFGAAALLLAVIGRRVRTLAPSGG